MNANAYLEPALSRESPLPHHATWWSSVSAEAAIELGRFQVLLRRRRLLADGVPVELGTRAFDLLLVLLEADGALVTKEEILNRVWPGIVVTEDNVKVQVSVLRRAFGEDRDFIRTEFGRGYRFTALVHSTVTQNISQRNIRYRSRSDQEPFPSAACRRSLHGLAPRSPVGRP
jgi:DNA-binding winged helix-turn-helix (wHTH) protein